MLLDPMLDFALAAAIYCVVYRVYVVEAKILKMK